MKKRKILILGGSSDIGVSLIKGLLKQNNLEIYAHCFSKKNNLLNLQSKKIKIIQCNFGKIEDKNFRQVFKNILNKKFDYFVNLTGYINKSNFSNFRIKDQLYALKVNVILPNIILSKIVNNMIKKKFGRIINCSSIGIKFGGGSNTYNYSLSKFASEFIPYNYKFWAKNNVLINKLRRCIINNVRLRL